MEIRLHFLGAAQNVTGSRCLIETNGFRALVDCGLHQERKLQSRDWDPFPIKPSSINAVVLTHAHLDHCGYLPKLVHEGFRGRIYCTQATAEIAQVVLLDSAKIQEEDVKQKLKRHKKENRKGPFEIRPLYTVENAEAVENLYEIVEYETPVNIGDGIEAEFHDAGHILGSAAVKLKIQKNGESRSVIFSGDVGRWDKPILRDPSLFENTDYLVIEATYGDRIHEDPDDIESMLEKVIKETHKAGGNVVIPSFAIERSQELLYHLNNLYMDKRIPQIPVFLDSPMAQRVTEIFKRHKELFDRETADLMANHHSPFNFPMLQIARTSEDSKQINEYKGGAIIIAGSGMCTGGRIKHHLVQNISRPESTILFVGYQAAGTLGRNIVERNDEVRIFGAMRPVRARIEQIHGFSAHADQNELMRWISHLSKKLKKVFVTHGEQQAAMAFAEHLKNKAGVKTEVPAYKEDFVLE